MNKKKHRYWIVVGVLWGGWLAASAAAWLLVFVPQEERYAVIHKQLKTGQDEMELARIASMQSTKQAQVRTLEQLRKELALFVIGPIQQDRLVFEVSRLASELDLAAYAGRIRSGIDKNAREKSKLPVKRVYFDVTFTGSFARFARFMNSLERNCPVLFVESASIERMSGEEDRHKARLLLSLLIQADESVAAGHSVGSQPAYTARRIVEEETPNI